MLRRKNDILLFSFPVTSDSQVLRGLYSGLESLVNTASFTSRNEGSSIRTTAPWSKKDLKYHHFETLNSAIEFTV